MKYKKIFQEITRLGEEKSQIPLTNNQDEHLKSFLNSYSILEMVSAQVKTTMNTVLGFLNLSRDERLSQQTKNIFTDYVYTSSSGLLQLFNHLIDLYQIANNTDARTIVRVNVNDLLMDIVTKYRSELEYRKKDKKELKLQLPDNNQQPFINTDKAKLVSVLEALIQNAIEFSGQGEIAFGYKVHKNEDLHFYFQSPNSNISVSEMEDALHTYIKNPDGLDITYVLASLRIEVAKRQVEKMGGTFWSSTNQGRETVFNFTINGEKQKKKNAAHYESEASLPDWKNFKVLIAEDLDSNYLLLKTMLDPTQILVERAKNGLEAVAMFKENKNRYDLVLMDIMMPEMDGFEAAKRIKGMNKNVPVIGQTAYCLESEDVEGKLKFFNDFLTKPIWNHELLRTLDKYLYSKANYQ